MLSLLFHVLCCSAPQVTVTTALTDEVLLDGVQLPPSATWSDVCTMIYTNLPTKSVAIKLIQETCVIDVKKAIPKEAGHVNVQAVLEPLVFVTCFFDWRRELINLVSLAKVAVAHNAST